MVTVVSKADVVFKVDNVSAFSVNFKSVIGFTHLLPGSIVFFTWNLVAMEATGFGLRTPSSARCRCVVFSFLVRRCKWRIQDSTVLILLVS